MPEKTATIIQRAINGDELPPVLSIKAADVIARTIKAVHEPQKMYFCGAQKYEAKLARPAVPANNATVSLTSKAEPISFTPVKYAQQYSAKIMDATKIIASQIRRCQKRVNVNGLIRVPPIYSV